MPIFFKMQAESTYFSCSLLLNFHAREQDTSCCSQNCTQQALKMQRRSVLCLLAFGAVPLRATPTVLHVSLRLSGSTCPEGRLNILFVPSRSNREHDISTDMFAPVFTCFRFISRCSAACLALASAQETPKEAKDDVEKPKPKPTVRKVRVRETSHSVNAFLSLKKCTCTTVLAECTKNEFFRRNSTTCLLWYYCVYVCVVDF